MLPVFTAGSRVTGDAAGYAIAVVALIFHCFCSCRPCRLNFVVHQGAANKINWQDDWRKRGQRWWESGGRARPSAKLLYRLARRRRLPERTEKAVLWAVHQSGAKWIEDARSASWFLSFAKSVTRFFG